MSEEYIRRQDAITVAQNYHCSHDITIIPNTDYSRGFYDGLAIRENDILQGLSELKPSADVVPISAYKQVVFERDTVVEQLKQIGKDIREVIDDVVHLQRRLSADVAQIRHSQWIKTEDGAECEKCGREAVYQIVDDHWEYEPWCPHCGSKMDGHGES